MKEMAIESWRRLAGQNRNDRDLQKHGQDAVKAWTRCGQICCILMSFILKYKEWLVGAERLLFIHM
jgi:hypothetical protein